MFCRECGKEINNKAVVCVHCGVRTGVGEPDAVMRMLLPVGRSGYAIAAGYLGLFSPLLIPAPLAVIFGILAIRDIKKNTHKHGMVRAIFGITIGAICTVLYAYAFLIAPKF
ncbi:DUF4190 domain-containing protein [Herbivorax sp. ANBcel31]|uniref:DUF4190 domain-containing protein n=1 Tax=Herbivorax sp. ANBcel31 TaxID=3069754 RepID=UPI0027B04E94|nr:DUF4190 domain-containing protein [Herbivorax sp. ANBcel31]MDQ2088101.1 DUF4190 domain-containing protein [Herbivorax sp. ANBcel31]